MPVIPWCEPDRLLSAIGKGRR